MGLTIHYTLRSTTRSPKRARELVTQLRSRALDLPFERVDDIIELKGTSATSSSTAIRRPAPLAVDPGPAVRDRSA